MNLSNKILMVFGTRPEAIKMAPLVKCLTVNKNCQLIVCSTGQHREMLRPVLEIFGLTVHYDLDLMRNAQHLSDITAAVLTGVTSVIEKEKPRLILVHGDTATALATSLAAFYCKIPIAHVEAGLRSGNKQSPWPEEINRRVISTIADLHFAPTEMARVNLLKEGIATSSIYVTGNTVVDAVIEISQIIKNDIHIFRTLQNKFNYIQQNKSLILVTGHRRENFGEGFRNICSAIKSLSERGDVEIVYPVHLNPNVKGPVLDMLSGRPRIHLIDPVNYLEFVYLMTIAKLILTDSGGVQEEAPSLGTPVLLMRDTTERPEAIEAGVVRKVGTCADNIVKEVNLLLDNKSMYDQMIAVRNPFGDGHASQRISEIITREP